MCFLEFFPKGEGGSAIGPFSFALFCYWWGLVWLGVVVAGGRFLSLVMLKRYVKCMFFPLVWMGFLGLFLSDRLRCSVVLGRVVWLRLVVFGVGCTWVLIGFPRGRLE